MNNYSYIYDNDSCACVMEYNCMLISFEIETDHECTSEASALVGRDFKRNQLAILFHNALTAIIIVLTVCLNLNRPAVAISMNHL